MRSVAFVVFILVVPAATAHETVRAADLVLSVGWSEEPPVAGDANGLEVVVRSDHKESEPGVLAATILYKGNPVANVTFVETSPGRFETAFTPPHAGSYVVALDGRIAGKAVSENVALPERAHTPVPVRGETAGPAANLPTPPLLAFFALLGAALFVARPR